VIVVKSIVDTGFGGVPLRKTADSIHFETSVPLKEVMQPDPTTIGYSESVAKAAMAMCRDEVGSCIVLKDNLPAGIVTEEDINCKVVARDRKPGTVSVHEIMSTPLITIGAERSIHDAAHLMISHRVRRLPVVDEEQKVIGIVTVRDILTISTEINDLMTNLIEINREYEIEVGVCTRCEKMSEDLRRIDNMMLCPNCREEELLQ
jgi:CBS domain-containing protein